MKYKKYTVILICLLLFVIFLLHKNYLILSSERILQYKGYKTVRIIDVEYFALFKNGRIEIPFRASRVDDKMVNIKDKDIKNGVISCLITPSRILYDK